MAKRFTDTDKWKKKWFRELGSRLRDLRQFILDDCNHAGIWEIDLDRAKYHIGQKVSLDDIRKAFKNELTFFDHNTKLAIKPFVTFQYGVLRETNNTHRSVLNLLKPLERSQGAGQPLPSPCPGDQDKDKDKDKDLDKDFRKESVRENPLNFETLYAKYPRKIGKKRGMELCKTYIKTPEALIAAHKAVERYSDHLRVNKVEPRFIKHFSTFMNSWEDWCDESAGKSENFVRSGLTIQEILAAKKRREEDDKTPTP